MRLICSSVLFVSMMVLNSCTLDESPSIPTTIAVDDTPSPPTMAVCQGGRFRCFAHVLMSSRDSVQTDASHQGFGATDLAAAYNLDTSLDPDATIGIIGAYGYANLESDLAAYRSAYNLPACSVASGCLRILNQSGATSPLPSAAPSSDDWTQETALDVDMASAACPKCKIVVIQADDDQGDGLEIAQNAAVAAGATVVSNSWGSPESQSDVASSEAYFNHSGVAIFVAAGDDGYNDGGQGPDYPATSAYTIGVGGTSLSTSTSSRGWTETAWRDGGSACSTNVTKPSWQTSTACSKRMSSDVSAVGDPSTGVATYNANAGGWSVIGGTSAASPLVAAIFALTGHGNATAQLPYLNPTAFYDVTSGTNGTCTSALCKAAAGWDGPTGIGTPNGAMLLAIGGGGGGNGSGSGGGNEGTGSGSDGGGGSGGGGGGDGTGSSNSFDTQDTGGCAIGGDAESSFVVVGIALLFVRRRRRSLGAFRPGTFHGRGNGERRSLLCTVRA